MRCHHGIAVVTHAEKFAFPVNPSFDPLSPSESAFEWIPLDSCVGREEVSEREELRFEGITSS